MKAGKDCRYISCGCKKKLSQLLFASFRQKCCVAEDLAVGFMGSGLCSVTSDKAICIFGPGPIQTIGNYARYIVLNLYIKTKVVTAC